MAEEAEMDVARENADEAPQQNIMAPQRILVDASNNDLLITESRRPRVPQENEKKTKVIKFIANAMDRIRVKFLNREGHDNLNVGDQIYNVFFTAYSILRQERNQTGGTLGSRTLATTYKINYLNSEYTVERNEIHAIVDQTAQEFNLEFKKYDAKDTENWYGVAGPLISFLGGFALRKKELRLGHSKMPINKRNNIEKVVNISQYGLYGPHHILCEGVTFPPEKRSSMAQSVGPMTALLCYIKSERRYSDKWLVACKRAFAHFPDIDNVLSILKERDLSEVRPLITLMADIALIATTRQAHRMFPPPIAFASFFTQREVTINGRRIPMEPYIRAFNFSGIGAFAFYKLFCSYRWTMNLTNATDEQAKQIVYHSMFGTFKEDLSLLAMITTTRNWYTREQLGDVFKSANNVTTPIIFTPVQQVYFSKLSQANQSGLLTSSYSQISTLPCFSGKFKRKYSDAFFEHMANTSNRIIGGKSLQALIATYSQVRDELTRDLNANNKILELGTKGWFKMDELVSFSEPATSYDLPAIGENRMFLGQN